MGKMTKRMAIDDWYWVYPKKDGVTSFLMSPRNLEVYMDENEAEYSGDYLEGSLQDNFVLFCKRGVAAVYEHYSNEWSSIYKVEFEPYPANKVWEHWYEFEKAYRKEFGDDEY